MASKYLTVCKKIIAFVSSLHLYENPHSPTLDDKRFRWAKDCFLYHADNMVKDL